MTRLYVASFNTAGWPAALAAAVAAATAAGGATVVLPHATTITLPTTITLSGNTTLLIPPDCTIVKSSGANQSVFQLAAPTYPAYTENVHIVGGAWRWDTTTTDPGTNDERGFINLQYGRGCTVRGATFHGANTTWPTRYVSAVRMFFCIDSHVRGITAIDTWKTVAVLADTTPDDPGRQCSGCTVRGVTLTRSGVPTVYGSYGVRAQGSSDHPVSGLVVQGCSLSGASINEFKLSSACTFRGNAVDNCMMGISVTGSPGTTVAFNEITTSAGANPYDLSVEITGSPASLVLGNTCTHLTLKGVGIGVYASLGLDSNGTVVQGNAVTGAQDGVQLIAGASYCRAVSNHITACTNAVKVGPAGGAGSATGDVVGCTVTHNTVTGCDVGVYVKRRGVDIARDLTISANELATTPVAIYEDPA